MNNQPVPKLCPSGNDFTPCSEQELIEVERILEAPLPVDYRQFVLKYGWSHYEPSAVIRTIEKPPPEVTWNDDEDFVPFGNFFGSDCDSTGLLSMVQGFPIYQQIPENMIAFADDICCNEFLLGLSGADKDKIYFWFRDGLIEPEHYEEEGLEVPIDWRRRNLTLVATSFSDFLERVMLDPHE
ncbi:MAG: SMI1/KNR4 family protein [Candidatus Obscuribacterales bacterium]|nr:SMI1/KNR4 family protein [Cyanobacteria bacterium HKST-UBA01]MCB9469091.1 SMI1/KNR4 family protein [Candidatus Obscuribacterales bacterium]